MSIMFSLTFCFTVYIICTTEVLTINSAQYQVLKNKLLDKLARALDDHQEIQVTPNDEAEQSFDDYTELLFKGNGKRYLTWHGIFSYSSFKFQLAMNLTKVWLDFAASREMKFFQMNDYFQLKGGIWYRLNAQIQHSMAKS